MIKKTSKGYKVVSKKGKNLSRSNMTIEEAKTRMKEVETFKHISIGEMAKMKRRKH